MIKELIFSIIKKKKLGMDLWNYKTWSVDFLVFDPTYLKEPSIKVGPLGRI